ncbi:recombinase family protein [Arthrobacter sp. KNU40]|uniref:recombinase family protein n=1 Tax=Arthrobacter sp. KNU40 TaxID=3447965 RepID=UPI003F5F6CDC
MSYIRVPTRDQAERDGHEEGFSIPAQREAIQRKAESLGAFVTKEFVERGRTGTNTNRPALQKMLAYIQETPDIDFVIVHKIDRLARTLVGDVDIGKILSAAGIQLVSTTENIDESPSGRLIHGGMSVIAEFYSRNLATEVLKGMRQKAERRLVTSTGTLSMTTAGKYATSSSTRCGHRSCRKHSASTQPAPGP